MREVPLYYDTANKWAGLTCLHSYYMYMYCDSTIDTTVSLLTSISMIPHYLRAEPVMLLEHPHNNLHLLCIGKHGGRYELFSLH